MSGGKNQPIQPNIVQTIPPEFLPFARDLAGLLQGRLGQPSPNPYQQGILNSFFGGPAAPSNPMMSRPTPVGPGGGFGVRPPIGLMPTQNRRGIFPILEGIEPPRPEPPIGGVPSPFPTPSSTPGQPLGGGILPPGGQIPGQAVPMGGFFGQGLDFLTGAMGGQQNPLLQQSQGALSNTLGGNINQPGLGQTQGFLGGLLSGQLPESLKAASAENLARSQAALNSQLQQRGGFFGSHGAQIQSDLARQSEQDLNNLIFQNAMSAAPLQAQLSQIPFQQQMAAIPGALQASQIPFQQQMQALQGMGGLFGMGMGMAGLPNQLPEALGPGIDLLGALRGTPMMPQYAPDPLSEILGFLPFLIGLGGAPPISSLFGGGGGTFP